MQLVRTLLDVLGGAGAVRNAEHALLARQAEERALDAVLERLSVADAPMARTPPRSRRTSGRVAVKSKNSSGSIEANGSAPHLRAR